MKVSLTIKSKDCQAKIVAPTPLAAILELLAYIDYEDAESLQTEVDSFVKEGRYER